MGGLRFGLRVFVSSVDPIKLKSPFHLTFHLFTARPTSRLVWPEKDLVCQAVGLEQRTVPGCQVAARVAQAEEELDLAKRQAEETGVLRD